MRGASISDDRGAEGFSWVMDEPMRRASHAIAVDGRVWIVDPVDTPEAMARVAALGEPAGVLQLLDRHDRDCAAVAERLGVEHHKCPVAVDGAPFVFVRLTWRPWWREVALWWPERTLLVVADAVGTIPFFAAGRGRVGVHPLLRLLPPRRLAGVAPRHLLVGHGAGLSGEAATRELRHAMADTRRGLPAFVRTMWSRRTRT